MKKFLKTLMIFAILPCLLFSDILIYAAETVTESEISTEVSMSIESEIETEIKTEQVTEPESKSIETEQVTEPESKSIETEQVTEPETESVKVIAESEIETMELENESEIESTEISTQLETESTEIKSEEELNSQTIEYQEYAFYADTLEQAQQTAQEHNAELVSFEYGIGVIKVPKTKDENVKQRDISVKGQSVRLYPQIYYTVDTDTYDSLIMPQWHLDAVNTSQAWEYSRGKGIIVAVIDSGIDTDNTDLKGNIYKAVTAIPDSAYDEDNFFDPAHKGPEDYVGHGTHVSGIIAAIDDNDGCVGIAPESKILSIKALEKQGGTGKGASSWIVAGIRAAIENKADVINMSLGGSIKDDELLYQGIKEAIDAGIVVVCAAGNISGENAKVFYPAAYDEVITVAAVKQDGESVSIDKSYSNFGSFIDISAPGTRIMSDMPGGYGYKTGTSMACPVVSGGVALLLARNPKLSNADVEELLYNSSTDMGTAGWDEYYGHGVINLKALMELNIEEYEKFIPIAEIPDNSIVGARCAIKFTTDIEGAKIIYTTDGTEPTADSSFVPETGIIAPENEKEINIKARLLKSDGKLGKIAEFHYAIEQVKVDITDKNGTFENEIIPCYGAEKDTELGVNCKKYNFEILAGETAILQAVSEEFQPKLALYIIKDNDLDTLTLKKSGKNFKWKNTKKENVKAVLTVSDSSQSIQTKELNYKLTWKVEKIKSDTENDKQEQNSEISSEQQSGGQSTNIQIQNTQDTKETTLQSQSQITEEPVVITPTTTDDWLYTMTLPSDENVVVGEKTQSVQTETELVEIESTELETETVGVEETESELAETEVSQPEIVDTQTPNESESKSGIYLIIFALIAAMAAIAVTIFIKKKSDTEEK